MMSVVKERMIRKTYSKIRAEAGSSTISTLTCFKRRRRTQDSSSVFSDLEALRDAHGLLENHPPNINLQQDYSVYQFWMQRSEDHLRLLQTLADMEFHSFPDTHIHFMEKMMESQSCGRRNGDWIVDVLMMTLCESPENHQALDFNPLALLSSVSRFGETSYDTNNDKVVDQPLKSDCDDITAENKSDDNDAKVIQPLKSEKDGVFPGRKTDDYDAKAVQSVKSDGTNYLSPVEGVDNEDTAEVVKSVTEENVWRSCGSFTTKKRRSCKKRKLMTIPSPPAPVITISSGSSSSSVSAYLRCSEALSCDHDDVSELRCSEALSVSELNDSVEESLSMSSVCDGVEKRGMISRLTRLRTDKVLKDGIRRNASNNKGGALQAKGVEFLQAWIAEHLHDPYPTRDQRILLSSLTGFKLYQVDNWLSNARNKLQIQKTSRNKRKLIGF